MSQDQPTKPRPVATTAYAVDQSRFEPHPTEARQDFAQWLATPSSERKYKTMKDYAVSVGIPVGTLEKWRRTPDFADQVRFNVCQNELNHAADVAKTIRDRALGKTDKGSAKHAELHLRHLSQIWNFAESELSLVGIKSESGDVVELLQTGRFGEQIMGMVESLRRKEQAIDAEYEVLPGDDVTESEGDDTGQDV